MPNTPTPRSERRPMSGDAHVWATACIGSTTPTRAVGDSSLLPCDEGEEGKYKNEEEHVLEDEEAGEYDDDYDEEEFDSEDDEWVLERLLRRRLNKNREGGQWEYLCQWGTGGSASCVVPTAPGATITAPAPTPLTNTTTTWETRESLEDAGWIPQLDAFDAQLSDANATKRRKPHASPIVNAGTEEDVGRQQQQEAPRQTCGEEMPPPLLDASCFPRDYRFPSPAMDIVEDHFVRETAVPPPIRPAASTTPATEAQQHSSCQFPVSQHDDDHHEQHSGRQREQRESFIALVEAKMRCAFDLYARASPQHTKSFLERWETLKDTHVPELCFHGTLPTNFKFVNQSGLRVGGSREHVERNGFDRGDVVLTFTTAHLALMFGSDCRFIFVCVGLVPKPKEKKKKKTKEKGEGFNYYNTTPAVDEGSVWRQDTALCFCQEGDVVPLWLVRIPFADSPTPLTARLCGSCSSTAAARGDVVGRSFSNTTPSTLPGVHIEVPFKQLADLALGTAVWRRARALQPSLCCYPSNHNGGGGGLLDHDGMVAMAHHALTQRIARHTHNVRTAAATAAGERVALEAEAEERRQRRLAACLKGSRGGVRMGLLRRQPRQVRASVVGGM